MDWTDETILSLRALWDEGLSTAEIGRRLGVTKNAVVGKAHRLVLSARPSPIRREGAVVVVARAGIGQALFAAPVSLVASVAAAVLDGEPGWGEPGRGEAGRVEQDAVRRPEPSASVDAVPVRRLAEVVVAGGPAVAAAPAVAVKPVGVATDGVAVAGNAARAGSVVAEAGRRAPDALPRPVVLRPVPGPRRSRVVACCWPIGEPGSRAFRFCDGQSMAGKPYCETHAQMAYVKVRDRREDAA